MANPFTSKTVSYGDSTDFDLEAAKIERARQMALALQQQTLAAENPNQMAGDRVVPYSPWQGAAKLAQALIAKSRLNSADERQQALVGEKQKAYTTTAEQVARFLNPDAVPSLAQQPGTDGQPQMVRPQPNRNAALAAMIQSRHPTWQQMGAQQMLKGLDKSPGEAFGKVDPKDYTPESIARFSQTGNFSVLVPVRKMDLAPNGQVVNLYGAKPGTAFNDPNKPFGIGEGGAVTPNQPYIDYSFNKAKLSAPNVSVSTAGKPFLTELGKGAAENVLGAASASQQAQATLQNVAQIRSGMSKAALGPGANVKVSLAQVGSMLGVTGKDTEEMLTNTRNVMQGLARQELAASAQMKGQGSLTEGERGILRRAEAGQISEFTKAELDTFLGAIERTANHRIGVHQRNMKNLRNDPNAAPIINYLGGADGDITGDPTDVRGQADAILKR